MSTQNVREPLTRHFTGQHHWIQRAVRLLARQTAHLRSGGVLDLALFRQFVHFFKGFAEEHHQEEERILFPWLRGHGVEPQVLAGLCAEHDESREHLKTLTDHLDTLEARTGDPDALEALLAGAERYAALISEHDWKEDHILYPMTEFLDTECELALEHPTGYQSCLEDPQEFKRWIEDVEAMALTWPSEDVELHLDPPAPDEAAPVTKRVSQEEDR
jgi:hemerythrin-like domain-containing protein